MTAYPPRVPLLFAVFCVSCLIVLVSISDPEAGDEITRNNRFELGDGVSPPAAGIADVIGDVTLAGPDWADLFDAERRPRDDFDEFGEPGGNGVPDILDTWGKFRVRRDLVFIADDVSAGIVDDGSIIAGPGVISSGAVEAVHDLGNAYAYLTYDAKLHLNLYAGLERIVTGESSVAFEFNQQRVFIRSNGELELVRTAGDVRIVVRFSPDLASTEFQNWSSDPDTRGWTTLAVLSGEDCSPDGSVCAFSNGVTVSGGAWASFGPSGEPVSELSRGTLLEVGADLGQLLNSDTVGITFRSLQLTTPQDYAVSDLARGAARTNGVER